MSRYCTSSSSKVLVGLLVGLFAAFLFAIPSAAGQSRDGFITITEGRFPFHLGVNPATNRIFTSSEGNGLEDGIITVIDGATNGIVAIVPVGAVAEDIVANPVTNLIYVGSYRDQKVAVIDGSDNTVIATVSVPESPFSIDVNPITSRVYVRGDHSVSVLAGSTNTVIATIPVAGGPAGLVVDSVANRIFVSDASALSVAVIDGASNGVIDTIPLDSGQPRGLAVNPAANRLYVAAAESVKVINTATMSVIAEVPIAGYAVAVTLNPLTNRLYVRTEAGGVAVIDTLTNTLVRTFVVSDFATNADIEVNPLTNTLYVPMAQDGLVWVAEDPASVGGRDFGINMVSDGVRLSWTSGSEEFGYSILRWAGNDGETMETIVSLAKGMTSYVDQVALTESAYSYALLPLDATGKPLWVSDIVGVWPSSLSDENAPTNFTLRHAGHAHYKGKVGFGVEMSWQAPRNQTGYVIAASYPDDSQEIPLPASAIRAIHTIDEPSCFTLYAAVGENVGYTHALFAVPLTWAMRNDPSLSRTFTSRMTQSKSTQSTVSDRATKSPKATPSVGSGKPAPSTKAVIPVQSTRVAKAAPSASSAKPSQATQSAKPARSTNLTQPAQSRTPPRSTKSIKKAH